MSESRNCNVLSEMTAAKKVNKLDCLSITSATYR